MKQYTITINNDIVEGDDHNQINPPLKENVVRFFLMTKYHSEDFTNFICGTIKSVGLHTAIMNNEAVMLNVLTDEPDEQIISKPKTLTMNADDVRSAFYQLEIYRNYFHMPEETFYSATPFKQMLQFYKDNP